MAPSKEATKGYVVSKVADDKSAAEAGVRFGWKLVSIAGKDCRNDDLDAVQARLKAVDLPVACEFEREKEKQQAKKRSGGDGSCSESEELDVLAVRAEHRMANQSGMDSLDELPVSKTPENLPDPVTDWDNAIERKFLNKSLKDKLETNGLKRPTVIQRHTIPIVMHENGHYDLIASAQTGSGKTFGFVIPTVARLIVQGANPRPFFPGPMAQASPLVLVLSPTRELAMQTVKEVEVLTKGTSLRCLALYGGESLKFQQSKLVESQTDIICATPGRLIDLIDANKLSLTFIQSVVLDEADQMLEQKMEVMCQEVLTGRDMPPTSDRQTLLFSATMPQKIRDMCPKILRHNTNHTANITVGHYGEDKGGGCSNIKQILRWIPDERDRVGAMCQDLQRWRAESTNPKGQAVIFTNQRLQAGNLAHALQGNGFSTLHLHGKLEQHVREEVFDKFRRGLAQVLVATNVASRGLDFPDVTFVVQYNVPSEIQAYTHRIGRTGRVGQVGAALSYVGPKDRHLFPQMKDFLELNGQEVPHFVQPREERGRGGWGGGGSSWGSKGDRGDRGGWSKGGSKGGGWSSRGGRSRSRDRGRW